MAWLFSGIESRFAERLACGSLTVQFPDGRQRQFVGAAEGPVASLTLHRWRALRRLVRQGSVGWYEAFVDGDWSSPDRVALFALFGANAVALGQFGRAGGVARLVQRWRHHRHANSRAGARRNIAAHYDLGNDFYRQWLDPSMTYSSAKFAGDEDRLEAAQLSKMDAIIDRLQLSAGDSLLEIGCGWGGLARRAIDRCGVEYCGLTLSNEQAAHVQTLLGDSGHVAVRDYRDEAAQYDSIASVEMVEAVGQEFWPDYLDSVARCLKPGGRAAIQYIAIDDRLFDAYAGGADFIQTSIFPGGCLISERRFRALAESRGLRWVDQVNFGPDYAATLRHWHDRYDAAVDEGRIPERFDQGFHQLWRYYFDYCEGGFRGGSIWVAQVTLVKGKE